MDKIFASPSRYVQGENALKRSPAYLKELGQKVLIITDEMVWKIVGAKLAEDLTNQQFEVAKEIFQGESSLKEIARMTLTAKDASVEVVIGLGGGKAIDGAKAVSNQLNTKLAIFPTSASTDAPTSAISVVYSEEGHFEKYLHYQKNPDLVLLDTAVISQAPVRLLKSGIADGMATWIEAEAVLQKNGENLLGGRQSLAALAIAEKCQQVLFDSGFAAVAANEAKVVTEALDAVIEANTLLSGIGFESGGLGAAHAIHNGFSAIAGNIHQLTHGEKVAYGTLVQLFLENRPTNEIDKYIAFYQKLGLPTTLEEMYLAKATEEELLKIGELATSLSDTIQQMPFEITAKEIAAALKAVDLYVKKFANQ